jgi:hypothetical protein
MRTWKFVAEVFWLYIGLCLCPQSAEQSYDYNQRTSRPTTKTTETPFNIWYASSLVRPPPPGHRSTLETHW